MLQNLNWATNFDFIEFFLNLGLSWKTVPYPPTTTFSIVPIYRSWFFLAAFHCHTVPYRTVPFHTIPYHTDVFSPFFFGGGVPNPIFYFWNLYFMVKLGYPENFIVLGCLRVLGKFVWWWWVDPNQLCSYSNLVSVELNYVGVGL